MGRQLAAVRERERGRGHYLWHLRKIHCKSTVMISPTTSLPALISVRGKQQFYDFHFAPWPMEWSLAVIILTLKEITDTYVRIGMTVRKAI